ncbi:MAG: MMPL family transporter [Kiloniellales bacterium]|nr:MMPL family transporter [Kiloniellales bacterium]
MIEKLAQRTNAALAGWVGLVCRQAWLVVLLAAVMTGVAATYTARTFTINTDTRDMISSEVAFRQNDDAFDAAFPQYEDLIVAVIDGPSAEAAETAADRLAEALAARPELFTELRRPGGEAFFRENAFLFLDFEALTDLADRLAGAEPLLGALNQDMSLRGLFAVLSQALGEAVALEDTGPLPKVLTAVAEESEATARGQAGELSWRSLLAADPSLVSTRAFVTAQPTLDHSSLKPAERPIAELRRLAETLEIDEAQGLRLRLTGPAALDHEEFESVEIGGATAGLVSLCAVAVLLILGLRSVSLVFATITTLLFGLTWTAAFAMAAIGHLNIISVAFAVLFVGLGVDFGIHFALRAREAQGETGDKAAALERAAASVGGALALSALCAATGFFAFLPTDYKGLAELGLISGSGMFIALFINLTLLPALMTLLPLPKDAATARRQSAGPIERLVLRHGRSVILAAVLAALAGVAAAPFTRFDFNPLNLKDPESESVATLLELTRDPDSSPYGIDVLARDLAAAAEIAGRLDTLPEVSHSLTLASFVPEDQEAKLGVIDEMALFMGPALVPAPPTPALDAEARAAAVEAFRRDLAGLRASGAADAALGAALDRLAIALDGVAAKAADDAGALGRLESRLLRNLPTALDDLRTALGAQAFGLDDLPTALRRDWVTEDGRARIEVKPQGGLVDNEQLRRFAEAVLAVEPAASGTPVVITEAGKAVVLAFYEASALALIGILVLLALALRQLKDAALVLAPLALAAAITTAASVVFGLAFNFANVIVLPLLLGLGVASGIHLVMRRRYESDQNKLLRTSTSRAVMFSALTTIASFGSLAVSGHPGMTSMGQLLTIAISSTLICTLIVLPSLMTRRSRKRAQGPGRS